MIFAKVDVTLATHPRALEAGPEAMGIWLWGLLYARQHETDGFLPMAALKVALGGSQNPLMADLLVGVGLWEKADGGWRICRYAAKNETRAAIEERRRVTRERVTAYRSKAVTRYNQDCNEKKGTACNAAVPDSDSVKEIGDIGDRARDAPSGVVELANKQLPTVRELEYRVAYEKGVESGSGSPFVFDWRPWDQGSLNAVLPKFAVSEAGESHRGAKLLAWIEAAARDFAVDVTRSGKVQFYGGFAPKHFARWLVEDEAKYQQAKAAKACP